MSTSNNTNPDDQDPPRTTTETIMENTIGVIVIVISIAGLLDLLGYPIW
jgi:hypothetical protein